MLLPPPPPLNKEVKERQGFTLIELSIVLVIIGLIVGGVLVGRDLVEIGKARKLMTQLESYELALNTFRLKYNCIPGDCANAGMFGLGTSGTGNGFIGSMSNSYPETENGCLANASGAHCFTHRADAAAALIFRPWGEMQNVWVHMANAGLIDGSYGELSSSIDPTGQLATYFPKAATDKGYLLAFMWNSRLYIRTGMLSHSGTGTTNSRVHFAQTSNASNSSVTAAQMKYIHEKKGYSTVYDGETNNFPNPAINGQRVFPSGMYTLGMPADPFLSFSTQSYKCAAASGGTATYNLDGGQCDFLWEIYRR